MYKYRKPISRVILTSVMTVASHSNKYSAINAT